jgi:exopolysaccharide biosynthesis WecB/TagA/CpsF family protein
LSDLIALLLASAGTVTAAFAVYLVTLALASLFRQDASPGVADPTHRLVVLVPAHDEELSIERTVASLLGQDYPPDLWRVVVIADNCTDRTAERAAASGASVMVREEPDNRGKGQALHWAIESLLTAGTGFDAVVVVDADSVVDRRFLRELENQLRLGHQVVQADYTLRTEPDRPRTNIVAAGFLLFHRVRFGGRRRLGMPANLVGNGMLFSREMLIAHGWSAFSGVEDLEFSIDLRLAGVAPRFAPEAHVEGSAAASRGGAFRQRLRWEGGRFHVMRSRLGLLLSEIVVKRDLRLLDIAIDLATPPLALLVMITGAGLALSTAVVRLGLAATWAMLPWAVALAGIAAFVVIGLISARAPRSVWVALALAPLFVADKFAAYLRLTRGFDPQRWDRSDRRGEAPGAQRLNIAGVPVDAVDMESALDRICAAIGGRSVFQVSTINLDFVVRARTDARVWNILRRSDLNLADGAPVLWLARLLGAELPSRVAGADLVPALAHRLATVGARLFLLGGENGTAEKAAAKLLEANPTLQIGGCFQPPRCALEDMPVDEILARIAHAHADVILVALGHPKQERWIDLNRDKLAASVAIGVGCVFDLLAGQSRRAPIWMQALGLEWAFRLAQEPRRLLRRYVTDAAWLIPITALVVRERMSGGWSRQRA